MKIQLAKRDLCTGCGACRAVCPVHAIDWQEDIEGLSQPIIDRSVCIQCGKCVKVCPILDSQDKGANINHSVLSAYAAQAKSKELLMKCSSGGIFGLLAGQILKGGGVVCGCSWSNDFKLVYHKLIESKEELPSLLESKYLQSEVPPEVYQGIATHVKNGRKVLFCGTPCEICGLDKFLKSSSVSAEQVSKSLFKIALICHGVPSPGVWRRFVEEEEARHDGEKIVAARFRDKRKSWQNFSQVLQFSNGEESIGNVLKRNVFMHFFWGGKNITLRRSCSFCVCKKAYNSDITLSDFWGIESILPEVKAKHGVSAVIVHTQHGQQFLDRIKNELAFCIPTDFHDIEKNNYLWHNCLALSPRRKRFFRLFAKRKNTLEEIAFLLEKESIGEKLRRLSFRASGKIKRMMKRLAK